MNIDDSALISYRDHHEHQMRLLRERQHYDRVRDRQEYFNDLESDRIERARRMEREVGQRIDRYA